MRSLLACYGILCLRKPLSKDYGTSIICHMVEIKTKLAEDGRMQNSDTGSRNDRHWESRLRLKRERGMMRGGLDASGLSRML
jgi:hypothetical protein